MYLLKFIILFILILFTGCAEQNFKTFSVEDNEPKKINYKRYYKTYDGYGFNKKIEPMINYKLLANDAITQVLKKNKEINKVIVTDFVDLTSLKNNSNMGYILSNSIKDSLINLFDIKVIESELSKYFKLSKNGLRLLSRDVKKVKNLDYKIDNAVVGTYIHNKNELIVFVKLIDLKTGLIKGSYTNSMLLGENTLIPLSYKSKEE